MPEGVGYGSQFTASVGFNLNIIGRHCYAYSGEVGHDSGESDLLNFRSPANSYIVAWFGFDDISNISDDIQYMVRMNEGRVWSFITTETPERSETGRQLLIPPGTHVRCTGNRKSGSGTAYSYATISGRVYGKID